MKKESFNNALNVAKDICLKKLEPQNIAVDCTMGKGNDTIFLLNIVGQKGKVYSFDIQKQALEKTKQKLKGDESVILIEDGHENMDKYIKEKVDLFMFNLGYLPGFGHSITTNAETTLIALKKAIKLLNDKGVILMVIYPGHDEGKQEEKILKSYTETLDQKIFNVMEICFKNQVNNPPMLICIEKR